MARTFILSSTTSDLNSGADFNLALVDTASTSSPLAVSVANNSTETSHGFTAPGIPGLGGSSTGTFTVEVNVTAANSAIQISTILDRVNSSGTVQASSSQTAEQSAGSTGVKTFTHTNPALGTWASGDRLRVRYLFRSTQTMGGAASITIDRNTTSCEVVTPFAPPPQNISAGQAGEADTAPAFTIRLGKRVLVGQAW